jgi:hypothetical protein
LTRLDSSKGYGIKKDFILYLATPCLAIPTTTYQKPDDPINKVMTSPPPP